MVKMQRTGETLQGVAKEAADLKAAMDEHAIVAITDPDGRITFVNDKFCALSKYAREELLGQDHRILNSGHHSKSFFRKLWRTIADGNVWHGEIKNRAKDGAFYWIAATIVPFLNKRGRPRQFVAIEADITEQKQAKEELADKLRLQGLLAAISSLFVALPNDRVDSAVEGAQRRIVEAFHFDRSTLWQLTEEKPGLVLTHCWQRPDRPALPANFETAGMLPWVEAKILGGKSFCFSSLDELPKQAAPEVEVYRAQGVKSNLTIPLIANGEVFGALAFFAVATERIWRKGEIAELKLVAQIVGNAIGRQRAELREEQLRNELAHTMRVATLGEISTALAHELNQPLAAILSNAQAARRFLASGGITDAELGAILADIVRDNKRAASVIHNLHAMVGKQPTARESCCLNELVREVLELMHGEFMEANLEVRPIYAPALPRTLAARVELQQVIVNLLINAIQAMVETPVECRTVTIETFAEVGSVTVRIHDKGHGIPPERLATIFAPFVSTKQGGLGMGLSICRRIIENHHGRIEACVREGGGATFRFSLPTNGRELGGIK
ncbi:MAG TPA: ATP-binding protein [Chthoniobacter sp.]|jgi:PAS domain S-box-containing protein